jgi:hypothetical protein
MTPPQWVPLKILGMLQRPTMFKSSRLTDVRWCHPKLRVRVKHLAGGKHLRHATVRGDWIVGDRYVSASDQEERAVSVIGKWQQGNNSTCQRSLILSTAICNQSRLLAQRHWLCRAASCRSMASLSGERSEERVAQHYAIAIKDGLPFRLAGASGLQDFG